MFLESKCDTVILHFYYILFQMYIFFNSRKLNLISFISHFPNVLPEMGMGLEV